jgi:flagellar FliL protein
MSAKSEPASPAAPAAPVAPAAPAAGGGGAKSWLPVIAALVLAPVATWATVEFVLVPRLTKKLAAPAHGAEGEAPAEHAAEPPAAAHGGGHGGGHGAKEGKEGKDGKAAGGPSYEFSNVVVNLAGTMGTRYLKTSFLVTAVGNADIKSIFEGAKPRLTDVTLNVLSALTLADLEEPGSKNIIREKLVNAYNQALGKKVADQVYFSDFVVQ